MAIMVYSPSQGWTHPLKGPPSMLFFNVLLTTSSMSVWYRRMELSAYACSGSQVFPITMFIAGLCVTCCMLQLAQVTRRAT